MLDSETPKEEWSFKEHVTYWVTATGLEPRDVGFIIEMFTCTSPLRCSLLLHSSPTPLPSQWDRRQSFKYSLGATFVIISQTILIGRHKPFGCATIACHNIKHILWPTIATRVAFYSHPDLFLCPRLIKVLHWRYKSWHSPRFFILNTSHTFWTRA